MFNRKKKLEEEKIRICKMLRQMGISEKVINAFMRVPREEFVPERYKNFAYEDTPLPIGYGQTISAIHMVAIMCDLLELDAGMKMLEIGTGSGYHAAVCAEIIAPPESTKKGQIITIEYVPELAQLAKKRLEKLGYGNVITVITGDGSLGYPEEAPYDRILVTAAAPSVPPPLEEQLKEGGIIIIPIGHEKYWQVLVKGIR